MRRGNLEVLLQEHEELVALFIHEDSMAWQLTLTLLAANGGVITGAYGLGLFDRSRQPDAGLYGVLLIGCLLNSFGFFVMQRSNIHRTSRLFRAYVVESELTKRGALIQTLRSAEYNIFNGLMLTPSGLTTRTLRWWERVEVLSLRYLFNVVAVGLLLTTLWVFFGRPWLQAEVPHSDNARPAPMTGRLETTRAVSTA